MTTSALLLSLISGLAIVQAAQISPQVDLSDQKSADLKPLISETLALNNRSSDRQSSSSSNVDNWTFDRVEYDLIEFLQDLNARYSQDGNATSTPYSDQLEKRSDHQVVNNFSAAEQPNPTTTSSSRSFPVTQSSADGPQISLASGDQDIGESSWQYGIFDRFTRSRASTTTRDPFAGSLSSDELNEELRGFNSPDCGLRNYYNNENMAYPAFSESQSVTESASKQQPSQERYKVGMKKHNSNSRDYTKEQQEAYESFKEANNQGNDKHQLDDLQPPASDPLYDSDFNLSSRRQWLQHQLGNTLQMLGFNGAPSNQSQAADFLDRNLNYRPRERVTMATSQRYRKADVEEPLDKQVAPAGAPDTAGDDMKLEARVIGGTDARLGDSPWSVSLQALVSRPGTGNVEYRHYCGGTIISERYVLTAAHCLDFMVGREARLFVVIGDLNWRMNTGNLYGRRFGVEKLIIHAGYKSTAFGHDIGLIKTKEPMKPVKRNGKFIVNSVCLPRRNVEHSGEAELVGWGLFSNRNEMADRLQIADVPILPRPLCVDLYRRRTGIIQWLIGIELITEKQICAGTFGRGICQGDSGSALVFNERVPRNRESRSSSSSSKSVGVVGAPSDAYKQSISSDKKADDSQIGATQTDPVVAEAVVAAKKAPKVLVMAQSSDNQQTGGGGDGIDADSAPEQTKATIIGIVAFGGIRRCSYQSLPGVYMQTSKYLDWILPRIKE